jgi:hypothetical protein
MATGTYWPKSRSPILDNSGNRAIGAKLYFFNAGTSTPRTSYSNADLSTPHTHPVLADGNGRWPAVFLQFGEYKETVTTSGGTELWSDDDIPNPAPFDETFTLDETTILNTGDIWCALKNGTRTGAVRLNGRTIGSAASGATERANADCADLYAYLWDNTLDAQCAVATGRGASAAADFAANKAITLPSWRGAVPAGFDDMGNSAAALYGSAPVLSGSGILAGSLMGENTHTLTIAELATHTPAGTIPSFTPTGTISQITPAGTVQSFTPAGTVAITDPGHTHTLVNAATLVNDAAGSKYGGGATGTAVTVTASSATTGITAAFTGNLLSPNFTGTPTTPTFTGNLLSPNFTGTPVGSSVAHNVMQRSAPVTWFIKL